MPGLLKQISNSSNSSGKEDTGIVYCPIQQTARREPMSRINANECTRIAVQGKRNKVDIKVPIPDTDVEVYLATIDLCRFAPHGKPWKKPGKVDCVYVLGQVPSPPSSPELS